MSDNLTSQGVFNTLHYPVSGLVRSIGDVAYIEPGIRYDYNVRACGDAGRGSGVTLLT